MKKNLKNSNATKFVFGWDGKHFIYSSGETQKLLATNDKALIDFFRKETQLKLSKLILNIQAECERYDFTKQNDYVVDCEDLHEDECRNRPIMASELLKRPEEEKSREEICCLFPQATAEKIAKSRRPVWKKFLAYRQKQLEEVWNSCFKQKFQY